MMKKTGWWVALAAVFCCGVMTAAMRTFSLSYGILSTLKLGLFLMVPFVLSLLDRAVTNRGLFRIPRHGGLVALILGMAAYGAVLGTYFLFGRFWDLSRLALTMFGSLDMTAENYVYVGLYLCFLDSMLEEYFFRGFLFTNLKKSGSRVFAWGFSAVLSGLYAAVTLPLGFHWAVYLLTFAGLTAGGLLLNYLREKFDTLYIPWIVHVFADLAMCTVGALSLS